jgi:ACS family hexuronate transporter-like MFS transporter
MVDPGTVDMSLDEALLDQTGKAQQTPLRTWGICGLMLLATMLNYMDRQALAQQASDIREELKLSNEDYGKLESGFGLAFAVGGIATGAIADRFSLRWLYPAILLGWSAVGFVTGWVTTYSELFVCRVLLGFFEAGQWPCALAASQRLLPRDSRPLGNSILQSGASLGAIATPIVVLVLSTEGPGGWRLPFRVIGAAGLIWAFVWLTVIRPRDLQIEPEVEAEPSRTKDGVAEESNEIIGDGSVDVESSRATFFRRLAVLIVVVITINFCWQYFRAWMPMMLERELGYSKRGTQIFSSAYYLVAGIGCLSVGLLVRSLAARGWPVHRARMATFLACTMLTALGIVVAFRPAGFLLLALLLAIAFGSLGQFPTYYAFTQELSVRKMGKVTGVLSFVTWISWALVSIPIGSWIDRTGSYSAVSLLAGVAPLLALLALALWWDAAAPRAQRAR